MTDKEKAREERKELLSAIDKGMDDIKAGRVFTHRFVKDAIEGKLDSLADKALKDFEEGQCKPL